MPSVELVASFGDWDLGVASHQGIEWTYYRAHSELGPTPWMEFETGDGNAFHDACGEIIRLVRRSAERRA